MYEDLITVIVPIYNCEAYLKRCIESLQRQTYQNLEIILVNDGSTDDSEVICKYYQRRDARIVYMYQKNNGPGSARNKGMQVARGKYILFCDSDDAVPVNGIKILWEMKDRGQLVVGGIKKEQNQKYKKYIPEQKIVTGKREISEMLVKEGYYLNGPYNKLFLNSIIYENQIMFCDFKYGEDTKFVYDYLYFVNQVCFIDKIVYEVYTVKESLSTKIVYNSWDSLKTLYEIGREICNDNTKANHLLLMRCIKTALLLECRISKNSFVKVSHRIFKYYIKETKNEIFQESFYNKIISILLCTKKFELLYTLMRLRVKLQI